MIIKAYVFDTEDEVKSKIAEIDLAQGFPSAGASTYCEYEFNNEKWIVKDDVDTDMEEKFGYNPIDFDYKENYPYYIEYTFDDDILKIYTYNLYPEPFRVIDIKTLSADIQDTMAVLESRIISTVSDCYKIEFSRKNSQVKLYSPSMGVQVLKTDNMPTEVYEDYNNVGLICNELVIIG